MSVDTPPEPDRSPTLRREALLPNERSRGLGTVAVVCTMAGVASGLALATTLMAMQVADSMSVRSCPYHEVQLQTVDMSDHGFLGITYVYQDGGARIDGVLPGTPADDVGLVKGDRLLSIDGAPIRSDADVQQLASMQPGTQPTLVVAHGGTIETLHPTLGAWPKISY